jgi:hypothetical protein
VNTTSTECPRCGYDLQGIVESWHEHCPLSIACSECGLQLVCADLFEPSPPPRCSFEHTLRRRIWRLLGTVLRANVPSVVWRQAGENRARAGLALHHEVVQLRLVIISLSGLLAMHGLVVAFQTMLNLANLAIMWRGRRGLVLNDLIISLRWALWPHNNRWGGMVWLGLDPHVVAPILMVSMMPLLFLLFPLTLRRARVRRIHLLRIFAYSLVSAPLALAALGIIGHMHAVVSNLAKALGWLPRMASLPGSEGLAAFSRWPLSLLVVTGVYLTFYWAVAARQYLRLPRAFAVAATATLIAALGAILLVLLIPGAGRVLLLDHV